MKFYFLNLILLLNEFDRKMLKKKKIPFCLLLFFETKYCLKYLYFKELKLYQIFLKKRIENRETDEK